MERQSFGVYFFCFSLQDLSKKRSTIIEDIKAIVHAQPEIGLAFFYFDTSDEAKQNSKSLLSSLAWSLTVQSMNYLPMKKLHEKNGAYHPTQDDLLCLLKELLTGFKQAYIVIDALDECDKYDQFLKKVVKVIHGWQLSQFHLLVSSRRNQDILDALKQWVTMEIYLSAELVDSDINTYILAAIQDNVVSKMWGHRVQEDVKVALTSHANGMYVVDSYVLDIVQLNC